MRLLRGDTEKPTPILDELARATESICDGEVAVLELGVYQGGSLKMWRDYFPSGVVVGIDRLPVLIDDASGRIHALQGDQRNTNTLSRAAEYAPGGFDLIVDDCSHIGTATKISFWHLFTHHLKPGGIYAIEDWGTGYWEGNPEYPDGRHGNPSIETAPLGRDGAFQSHPYGIAGFIKQLVDEVGMGDITHGDYGIPPHKSSRINELRILPYMVLIIKALA
jgi:SAM-dependent methyltransferase